MTQPMRMVIAGLSALLAAGTLAAVVSGGGTQDWNRPPQHVADSVGLPGQITLADSGGGMPGKP